MAGRREWLRGLAGMALLAALPAQAWGGKPEEKLLERYPWLRPWVEQDGLDEGRLQALLGNLAPDRRVLALMDRQAESLPYHAYRGRVLNDQRIRKGRRMLERHRATLTRVMERYPASPEVVVALWGVESDFGAGQGEFNVLRTLFTLAAHYPRRAEFFREQLREFLLWCREEGWDPRQPKGSYAGALGQVQMMPGTLRKHAVDFNQDGKRDVVRDVGDALASIASFLHGHDWRPRGRMAQPMPDTPEVTKAFADFPKIRKPWREWRAMAIPWPSDAPEPDPEESLALIALEEPQGLRYYMTFSNFWVITQWNRSSRFAMVVHEFSLALRT
ncbi:MAG: lytic murein transglycosylase [Magnetococcales bacterium]|nr:lytic murein transglycosylase [Magnetococcales bacterium]